MGGLGGGYGALGFQPTLDTGNYILTGNNVDTIVNSLPGTPLKFRVGNVDKVTVLPNGNMGIGTITPATGLQIQSNGGNVVAGGLGGGYGALGFQSTLNTGNFILAGNNIDTIINSLAGTPLRFRVGNVDKMLVDAAGNFGVGTVSPAAPFHLA